MSDKRTLSVNLIANSARFTRGIEVAQKRFKRFRTGVMQQAKRIAASMAVITSAVVAMGAAFVKSGISSVDALAKVSAKLGIGINQLQGFRGAAERAGIDSGQFDTALQRMVRRLSEAAQGTGEAKDAIKELGLDAQRLASMAPDQALLRIADAFAEIPNQNDRVRLAFKLFDTEGVALVNLLGQGSAAIQEQADRVNHLRGAISAIDASAVERANDAFSDLRDLVQGFSQRLAVQLAPTIVAVGNATTIWLDELGGMDQIVKRVLGDVEGAFKGVQTAIDLVVKSFQTLKGIVLSVGGAGPLAISKLFPKDSGFRAFMDSINEDAKRANQRGFLGDLFGGDAFGAKPDPVAAAAAGGGDKPERRSFAEILKEQISAAKAEFEAMQAAGVQSAQVMTQESSKQLVNANAVAEKAKETATNAGRAVPAVARMAGAALGLREDARTGESKTIAAGTFAQAVGSVSGGRAFRSGAVDQVRARQSEGGGGSQLAVLQQIAANTKAMAMNAAKPQTAVLA